MHRPAALALLLVIPLAAQPPLESPPPRLDRPWIGPAFWANRLQDWALDDGTITCTPESDPGRTLHVLTRSILADAPGGDLHVAVAADVDTAADWPEDGYVGLWLGAGAPELDARARALVQGRLGPDGGLLCVVDGRGRLAVHRHGRATRAVQPDGGLDTRSLRLSVDAVPAGGDGDRLDLTCRLHDATDTDRARVRVAGVPRRELAGNIALACQRGGPRQGGPAVRYRFRGLHVSGSGIGIDARARFGPIAGALHTVQRAADGGDRGTLRLTAQLLPLGTAHHEVSLETRDGAGWRRRATATVVEPGSTAHFTLDDWDTSRDVPYRLRLLLPAADGGRRPHSYTGTVRAVPAGDDELVVAAFTGNHNVRSRLGTAGFPWNRAGLWFPHDDLVRHVRTHAPDLLFFSGDQLYENASPTRAQKRPLAKALLDYQYKWLLFVWAFGELTRELPAVTIPDDHDVYQGNLWGAGGRATDRDTRGGYLMPPAFVRLVERTQTAHLPPPPDPTPVDRGIGVYYTRWRYGGVDFAILEDRKFKSGPLGIVPDSGSGRPDHIVDPDFDPRRADVAGAELLGARQLHFLDTWARDWSGDTRLKMALSQTVFAGLATHHGGRLKHLVADLDSNGWPQSGRRRAVAALRRGFALHVAGDQHLATLCWHGLDAHRDANWSFAVPSIANFYPRKWAPPGIAGGNREPGMPAHFGDHRDGLGNLVSIFAAANPGASSGREPAALHDRMPGYGIVRCEPRARTYTVECWPRGVDPRTPGASQYPGWPRTLSQRQQYGREPVAWLPELVCHGVAEPVVELRHAGDGELVYALRAPTPRFRPWTFAPGRYAVRVSSPDGRRVETRHLEARPEPGDRREEFRFGR